MIDAPTEPLDQSAARAWWALVALSMRRQFRLRQMLWIALGLLAFTVIFVAVNRSFNGWGMYPWRYPRFNPTAPQTPRTSYLNVSIQYHALAEGLPLAPEDAAFERMGSSAFEAILKSSQFSYFANNVLLGLYVGFLLPLWSLSFASDALGGEREQRTLGWLVSRPIPRPMIFLAKFAGALPWCLGLNLFGLWAIGYAAGPPGIEAFRLLWPAVVLGTIAFAALFHLFGTAFEMPTVMGLLYSFFLEIILGNLPGRLKQVSIGYYVRCAMFDLGQSRGLKPDNPAVFLPVSGWTATAVLLTATALLLGTGMILFSRTEYRDDG